LFILKFIRIKKGLDLYDVQAMMDRIKSWRHEYLQYMIKEQPSLAQDTLQDNNQIENMLMFSYFFKILKLVIMISNTSFFLGMFWY